MFVMWGWFVGNDGCVLVGVGCLVLSVFCDLVYCFVVWFRWWVDLGWVDCWMRLFVWVG